MLRAKLNGKYPYLTAVVNGNGRVKPGLAMVKGVETKVEGSYYIRYTAGGKRRCELVKGDAAVAGAAAQKTEMAPKAKALGIAVVEETKGERSKLGDAIAEYKAEIREHKAKRSHVAYAYGVQAVEPKCRSLKGVSCRTE
jgi:hypothetical protein